MATLDYTRLDRPEISMNSFYPRRNWTDTPPGAQDHTIPAGPDVSLSARFFPADVGTASILYFCGNGETAADYDDIALWYNSVGVNFFVVDYRGYGMSGGSPAFSTMLSDAWQVLDYVKKMLSDGGYRGGLFVMGRSMGRHAAFELAAGSRGGRERGAAGPAGPIAGVIIESGRPTLGQFTRGLPSRSLSLLGGMRQTGIADPKIGGLSKAGYINASPLRSSPSPIPRHSRRSGNPEPFLSFKQAPVPRACSCGKGVFGGRPRPPPAFPR